MSHDNLESPHVGAFTLGRLVATPGALKVLGSSEETPADFLARHARGEWGCISPEDARENDRAVEEGDRILSAYRTAEGAQIWIITEAADSRGQRPATTILLPDEY